MEFNLSEAIRLRSLGWSNRRIAWELNCGSEETVRLRLAKFQPSPAIVAAAPEPPAVEPPSPLASAAIEMPVETPELAQPSPVIPQAHSAATIPTPSPEVEPPPIEDNALQLLRRHPWLTEVDQSWRTQIFVVNAANPLNLQYASNNGQHCVALTRWHEDYRRLAVFKDAKHIWVVLDANDDNAVFLGSLVNDIWIREKCLVARVDSVLDVTKYKTTNHKMFAETFETVFHFQPLPSPNHVELIRKLLEKPPVSKFAQLQPSFGGVVPWQTSGGSGYAPPSDWKPKIPSGGNPDGNDGSGFAF
ncbi:MAG: hypothetical protein WCB00_24255 [Candidatus Acidiferrales bacterium]